MSDYYKTIKGQSEGFFKDRNSKFYAFAYHVESEDEVKEHLKALQKKFHDARHIVYAFVIGENGDISRASDSGEPAGSSGPPVLRAIKSAGLTNILIAVVRYFGGKKLGIPGLINAYGSAAQDAIDNAQIETKVIADTLTLECPYNMVSKVMHILEKYSAKIVTQEYGTGCKMEIEVPQSKTAALSEVLEQNRISVSK